MKNNELYLQKQTTGALQSTPPEEASGLRSSPGRVSHDTRGTAVWNWDVATGVLAGSNANELLRMLDNPTLEVTGDIEPNIDWAGDPYNRR